MRNVPSGLVDYLLLKGDFCCSCALRVATTKTTCGDDDAEMQRDKLGQPGDGGGFPPSRLSGLDRMRNPGLNKVKIFCNFFFRFFFVGK